MTNHLKLRLFGRFALHRNKMEVTDVQAVKTQALLSYLAVTAYTHNRSALAGLLWGGLPETKARGNLSKTVSTLRQVIGDHLVITRQTVAFVPNDNFWLDVASFEAAINDGSIECLQIAGQLYEGDFLDGFHIRNAPEFEDWVLTQQVRLKSLAVHALHTLTSHFAEQDETGRAKAIEYARRLLKLEPWREEAHRQMMRLLAQTGQRGAALAQYETCQAILAEELGVQPDEESTALYEQIRRGLYEAIPNTQPAITVPDPSPHPVEAPKYDLLEMPETSLFFGRADEVAQLRQWVVDDNYRLCAVLGIGGVGKTSLAATFVSTLVERTDTVSDGAKSFEKILWRSLLNAPSITEFLQQSIPFLSDQQIIDLPPSLDEQLRILLNLLQQQRCLLILDNAESLMQSGDRAGAYRAGYEAYGQLIQRVAQSKHQSCLLITSRERPQGLARLERDMPWVKSCHLSGLQDGAAQQILAQQGFDTSTKTHALIERYSGHPLALKLVAETIDALYFGDVDAFLTEETLIFADIGDILDQQFARLSMLEQEIMIWLAIEREPISMQTLSDNLLGPVNKREYVEALRALQRRNLLEKQQDGLTLQNVITEYTTDRFISQVSQELQSDNLETFNRHALFKAQAKAYVAESQRRLILQPIAQNLLHQFGRKGLKQRCKDFLDHLRLKRLKSYAGGNILNLLLGIDCSLNEFDFSGIDIRQAYLQGANLQGINFSQANLSDAVFTDTLGVIHATAFSPDGQLIIVAAEGEIRVQRAVDGQLLRSWPAHAGLIRSIAISPDGNTVASGGSDQVVHLWDVERGQKHQTLTGHTGRVWSVCFSPDGNILASGGDDQTIRLWDAKTGQAYSSLSGHTDRVMSVCFSPDGHMLASGSGDQSVRLWDMETGQMHEIWHRYTAPVRSVYFSPDGNILASGGDDALIHLWDLTNDRELYVLSGHTGWVMSLCFSPDGNTLASGGDDQTVRLWDAKTGQIRQTWHRHSSSVSSVCFSPDGQTLASASDDQTMLLVDTKRGHLLRTWQGYTRWLASLCYSPDGRTLASGGADQMIRLWDTGNNQLRQTIHGHTGWVTSLCYSPDGQILASGSADQTIRVWDNVSGEMIQQLHGHTNVVRTVCFSPDGQMIASSSQDDMIRLWDRTSGKILRILQGHTSQILSICFSPDGLTLASGSEDQTIRLWDVADIGTSSTSQARQIITGHTDMVYSVCFSPDGCTLASSSRDRTIRLWDITGKAAPRILSGHTDWIRSIYISPDGQTLASGSEDKTVRIWNLVSGQLCQELTGHSHSVNVVCFPPDGRILASSSGDGTIKFWDVQTGECLQTLHPDRPYERMNITNVTGITEAQKATLRALGAVDLG